MSKKPLEVIAGAPDRPLVIGNIKIELFPVGLQHQPAISEANSGKVQGSSARPRGLWIPR